MNELEVVAGDLGTDGFAFVRGGIDRSFCEEIARDVISEYDRLYSSGWRFKGGGRWTRHISFTYGPYEARVFDLLKSIGLVQLAEEELGSKVEIRAMAGNFNLPASRAQNYHQDWNPPTEAIVINIGLVPTTVDNGATDILPGTQADRFSYRSLYMSGTTKNAVKADLNAGDVVIRRSSVWHRGTPNNSNTPRPMLAVVLFPAESPKARPVSTEPIGFYANRFSGRYAVLLEFVSVFLSFPIHVYRLLRS